MKAKKKRSEWSVARIRAAALIVVAVLAGYFAVRLAIAPGLEQRRTQENQTALLDSIRQGEGVIAVDERVAAAVDYYDGGNEAPAEEAALFAPLMEATAPMAGGIVGEPIDTGIVNGIGILTIDSIDLELPVAEGVSDAQLKITVGHVPGTAVVGEIGNAVIAGHRNYTFGEHFNRLGDIEIGDLIQYRSIDGKSMVFVVEEILETTPGDQSAFSQPEDSSQLTLYTCTPIRTATHRLIIRASRII